MKFFPLLFLMQLLIYSGANQINAQPSSDKLPSKPKLIIGIVVDQMRYDFLYKYESKYGDKGLKRLLREGYSFENTHYNYVPTYTGPGHAAIYTGASPAYSGIVGNDWYERVLKKSVYVTEDKNVKTVGSTSAAGEMSPTNLLSTTITDELKIFTSQRSKVFGIALKDRGAILPAGHTANAAYWYDGLTGNWISSTYYMQQLPGWVKQFNERGLAKTYLSKSWETLLPLSQYHESTPDNMRYERPYDKESEPIFPHQLSKINQDKKEYALLRSTPFGNSFTLDFALELLGKEKLGQGPFTDFLTLSFSSTDYVGHQFGPNSVEVEDTYLRLDKEIERFLNYVDTNYGKDNVLVFLTADHGAIQSPAYLKEIGIHSGVLDLSCLDSLKTHLKKVYGHGEWIEHYENQQIYLDRKLIAQQNLNLQEVQRETAYYLQQFEGIYEAIPSSDLRNQSQPFLKKIQLGFYPNRSGDVILVLQPGWLDEPLARNGGTSHGSYYSYDTHVPLVWYGWKTTAGKSNESVCITDIAPTLAAMLQITEPSASLGRVLNFIK